MSKKSTLLVQNITVRFHVLHVQPWLEAMQTHTLIEDGPTGKTNQIYWPF